jgi:hypothetical protein
MKKMSKGKKAIVKKYTPTKSTKHFMGGINRVGGNRPSRGQPMRTGKK